MHNRIANPTSTTVTPTMQELTQRAVLLELLVAVIPRLAGRSTSFLESFLSAARRCVADAVRTDAALHAAADAAAAAADAGADAMRDGPGAFAR